MTSKKVGVPGVAPVPQPNEKLWKENVAAETKQIDTLKGRIGELQSLIKAKTGGKEEFQRKRGEVRGVIDALQKEIEGLEKERASILSRMDSLSKRGTELRTETQSLKKSLGCTSEAEIDQKINEIAHQMQTSTMSLKDEKMLMAKIQQLKNSKPLVEKYNKLESSSNTSNEIMPLRSRLDEIRAEVNKLRDARREQIAKQNTLIEERNQLVNPVTDLVDEKYLLAKKVEGHIIRRDEINREYDTEFRKYREYLNQVQQVKQQQYRVEEKLKAVENEKLLLQKQLEREDDIPFSGELQLLTQIHTYLKTLQTVENNQEETKPSQIQTQNIDTKEDEVYLVKKNEREEEFFFAPKKKNPKQKTNKPKKRIIKHDIGTMTYFQEAGIEAPISEQEIQTVFETVTAKIGSLQQKQSLKIKETDNRRAKIQAKLDALDGKVKPKADGADEPEKLVETEAE